jgi:hypothetical protein
LTVVYDDQDTDTSPFNAMLEETAFNNQQDKKIRLHTLSTSRLGTPSAGQASPEEAPQWASRHALKNKHTKNKKKRERMCPYRRRQTRVMQDVLNATSEKRINTKRKLNRSI